MKPFNSIIRAGLLGLLSLPAVLAQTPAPPRPVAVQKAPILSRWERAVTPANAWREYPRPQRVRERWLNLNGTWQYAIRPLTDPLPTKFDGSILVPFAVESTLSGVNKPLTPEQRLWYRREVSVPADWKGQRVLLHFEAVDYECTLWINGGLVGSHAGGSDAFSFDITKYLNPTGTNELVLAVTDPTSTGEQPRGKQVLNPSGIFYTAVSGIWQTVWLEPVPENYIEEVRLTPELDSARVRVEVLLDRPSNRLTQAVRVTALDGTTPVATAMLPINTLGYLRIPQPKTWSPDSPFLYNLTVELVPVNDPFVGTPAAGQSGNRRPRDPDRLRAGFVSAQATGPALDRVTSYFAMRKISVGSGPVPNQPVLLLNNEFVFQNGPLDQGWWPGSLLTPPSDSAMLFEIDFLKRSGFNMLRKHIKIEPARYYYHCDRLGMLVWQDMPSSYTDGLFLPPEAKTDYIRRSAAAEQFELELRRMMNRLHPFPSIVTWVVHNEGWGQYDNQRLARWVKDLDPSRLVNAASGWSDFGAGDYFDIHTYEEEPRAPEPKADRVVAIGEFGGIGWPIQGHLWNPGMRNWGYQTYQDAATVEKAYRRKYAKIVEYYQQRALSAAVYTQTTDVEGEVNGLLTYDREVIKIPVATLREIHAPLLNPRR
jgi:beta-galactosidase/beta-glucuronidase